MTSYYRLLDYDHRGAIVRADGMEQYRFESGRGWIRSGILLHYQWPESDTYDMYEEISEAEAMAAISRQV